MRVNGSIEIDRPIDEVFRLTTEHVTEWSTIVLEEHLLEQRPEGLGTTFRTVTEDHGKRMEFQGVVTQYDPPYTNAIRMTGDNFDLDVEYSFEDLSGRTRMTQKSNVQAKGLFKVFLFLFGWMMNKSNCKALQQELERLKQFCEQYSEAVAS